MKMKFIIVPMLLIFTCPNISYANVSFNSGVPQSGNEQFLNNSAQEKLTENYYKNISSIEQKLFGKDFPDQDVEKRISRIERRMFTTTYPNSSKSQRVENIISNFNNIQRCSNISSNSLSRLESKILGLSNSDYTPERRIEKMEEKVFGATQSGDLSSRLKALQIASKNLNQDQVADSTSLNPFEGKSSWGNFPSNFMSLGGGTMTGFTPSITPQYNTGFGYVPRYDKTLQVSPYIPRTRGMYQNPHHHNYGPRNRDYGCFVNPSRLTQPNYTNYSSPYTYGYRNNWSDVNTGAGVTILN